MENNFCFSTVQYLKYKSVQNKLGKHTHFKPQYIILVLLPSKLTLVCLFTLDFYIYTDFGVH